MQQPKTQTLNMAIQKKSVDYSTLTVAQLKELLGEKGLKKSGPKADLVKRLEEAYEKPTKETKPTKTTKKVESESVEEGSTDYSTLKVAELKELLAARSLKKSGNKVELVRRLQEYDDEAMKVVEDKPKKDKKTKEVKGQLSKKADYHVGQKIFVSGKDGEPIIYEVVELQSKQVIVHDEQEQRHRMAYNYPFHVYEEPKKTKETADEDEQIADEEKGKEAKRKALKNTAAMKKKLAASKTISPKMIDFEDVDDETMPPCFWAGSELNRIQELRKEAYERGLLVDVSTETLVGEEDSAISSTNNLAYSDNKDKKKVAALVAWLDENKDE